MTTANDTIDRLADPARRLWPPARPLKYRLRDEAATTALSDWLVTTEPTRH